jgi:hypothetical protein
VDSSGSTGTAPGAGGAGIAGHIRGEGKKLRRQFIDINTIIRCNHDGIERNEGNFIHKIGGRPGLSIK